MTLPYRHDWDVDIKLSNEKISTKGDDHSILKIFNSGRMMASLLPGRNYKENTLLGIINNEYLITSGPKQRSILSFKTEFNAERDLLEKIPDDSTLIINGYIKTSKNDFRFLIDGLKVKWVQDDSPFTIIISKQKSKYSVKTSPVGLETQLDENELTFKDIYVWENYGISRVRFTQLPVTENEIKFL